MMCLLVSVVEAPKMCLHKLVIDFLVCGLGVILLQTDFDCKQRSYTYLVLKDTTTFKNLSKVLANLGNKKTKKKKKATIWVWWRKKQRCLFHGVFKIFFCFAFFWVAKSSILCISKSLQCF